MYEIFFEKMNTSLESKSWFLQENFLDDELCKLFSSSCLQQSDDVNLKAAKIGDGHSREENISIRKGSIQWIEYLEGSSTLKHLHPIFTKIMLSTNKYFRLSLKRFESQFSIYQEHDFYKTHLDQHKKNKHRQISCCLYLNDCNQGGELVIYKKGSNTLVDTIIKPTKGSIVLFFSADIYHEVRTVTSNRHSITTWFRDDDDELSL